MFDIGENPFAQRLLFPFLVGSLSSAFGVAFIDAAHLLNTFSSIAAILLTYVYWRRSGISRWLAGGAIAMFAIASLGPLRYSNYYPGGSFGVEMLTVWAAFFALSLRRDSPKGRVVLSVMLVIVGSLSREFVVILVAAFTLVSLLSRLPLVKSHSSRSVTVNAFLQILTSRPLVPLCLLSGASMGTYLAARIVAPSSIGVTKVLHDAWQAGYFRFNLLEFAYPYFYGLGPFVAVIVLALLFPQTRAKLQGRLVRQFREVDIAAVFIAAAAIFAVFGGTDADRFVIWMFPFFGLLALLSIQTLLSENPTRAGHVAVIAIVVAGAFWTRFYVPAVPHLIFTGSAHCSTAGVKTNYNPELFVGFPLLERFRQPLRQLPDDQSLSQEITALNGPWQEPKPFVAAQAIADCSWQASGGAYLHSLNSIPVPFGFPHNQFEMLSAHPTFGSKEVRFLYLGQWVLLIVASAALYLRGLRSLDHSGDLRATS